MVFSSTIFLFLFLPTVLTAYYLLNLPGMLGYRPMLWRRLCNTFLFIASLVFYFWGEQFLVWIVITSTAIDYICALIISGGLFGSDIHQLQPGTQRTSLHKFGLAASILSNLAFLCVFKYFNFGVDSWLSLMKIIGLEQLQIENVIRITLPLGISFYTFQSMSYTIDVYRGNVKATRNFIDFACYVTMFPQLVAGPIVRYRDIAVQLTSRNFNSEMFASGVSRFIIGLGKKVLIANTVAVTADNIFALPNSSITTEAAWLAVIAYTIQIYFDFSGYSDMAIGLGRMFGFEFLENFNYPYIARSVRDFWRRWHISLSTWFKDYLYIPLGGNRRGPVRTYLILVIVFFLCGLWHGASWTFVVWGLYHGLFLVLERLWLGRLLDRCHGLIRHPYTLLVICCGWVIFRAENISQTLTFLSAMFGFGSETSAAEAIVHTGKDVRIAFIIGIILSTPVIKYLSDNLKRVLANTTKTGVFGQTLTSCFEIIALSTVMLLCSMSLASGTHNPFIYFRF